MDDNLSLQADEIEALISIYENDVEVINEATRTYQFRVYANPPYVCNLYVTLPSDYPAKSAPTYELRAPWLNSDQRKSIYENLNQIYIDSSGESILYEWIEYIKNFIDKIILSNSNKETDIFPKHVTHSKQTVTSKLPIIMHSDTLTDRRSTFQAHLSRVFSVDQVALVHETLLENRKIANATHNIMAYRICKLPGTTYLQNCDDDGENAAGKRLLHLLQILDVRNVVVVVSRWYGGIQLGPDRFKHINNVARGLLVQEGFVCKSSK